MVVTAYICAGVYLAFFILLVGTMGIYYNIIDLHK